MVSKNEIKDTVKKTWGAHAVRVIGAFALIAAFVWALVGVVSFAWITLIIVGLIDLYLIYIVKEITISRWIRQLCGHRMDNVIMIGLCVAVWFWKGETLALWFVLGLLNNHFFERND